MPSSSCLSTALTFVDLPAEIRVMVYKHVFKGAKVNVSPRDLNWHSPNPQIVRPPNRFGFLYKTHALGCTRPLLATCKLVQAEAMPILSAACTLIIHEHFGRSSVLKSIPISYLPGIKAIEVDINSFVHVPRALLPALKSVVLTHHICEAYEEIRHMLMCTSCGYEDEIVRMCTTEDIQDWKWKRVQYMKTAQEEGFELNLVLRVNGWSMQFFDMVIDLEKLKLKDVTMGSNGKKMTRFAWDLRADGEKGEDDW